MSRIYSLFLIECSRDVSESLMKDGEQFLCKDTKKIVSGTSHCRHIEGKQLME